MFAPESIPMLLLGLSQICGYEEERGSKTQTSQSGNREKQALLLVA